LIEKFIEKKDIDSKNIAVALNETLIKKSEWNKTKVSENDRIEIVVPFAGG
jgi:thiamine biosynthesis protein ThiS